MGIDNKVYTFMEEITRELTDREFSITGDERDSIDILRKWSKKIKRITDAVDEINEFKSITNPSEAE